MQPVGTLLLILRDLFHRKSPGIDGGERERERETENMSAKRGIARERTQKEHSRTAGRVEETGLL